MFLKSTNKNNPPAAAAGGKPPAPSRKAVPSVISGDMNILGNIVSEGVIDFDGCIDGNIRCGTLVLRPNGRINGEVHAETVQVYGKVKGLIKARMVNLYASCAVQGVIMHETIAIEDGANIDGKFKRINKSGTVAAAAVGQVSAMPMLDKPADEEGNTDDAPLPYEGSRVMDNIRLIAG